MICFSLFLMSSNVFAVTLYVDAAPNVYGSSDYTTWETITFAAVAPVPEPATMLLFGLGILGLAGVSRKKLGVK